MSPTLRHRLHFAVQVLVMVIASASAGSIFSLGMRFNRTIVPWLVLVICVSGFLLLVTTRALMSDFIVSSSKLRQFGIELSYSTTSIGTIVLPLMGISSLMQYDWFAGVLLLALLVPCTIFLAFFDGIMEEAITST